MSSTGTTPASQAANPSPISGSQWVVAVFAATVFLSAALLFQLEPLVGKSLLPWYGGTPAVWNTCVVFFQAMLLLGYLYAHLICRWLSRRLQFLVHGIVVGAALLTLPIRIQVAGLVGDTQHPVAMLLMDLMTSVGPVFFVVSTTAPLLQAWYAVARPAGSPYRLYVASNLGSLVSLLAYPTLVEFWLPLSKQASLQSIAFAGLAVLVAGCAALAWRGSSPAGYVSSQVNSSSSVNSGLRLKWFLWSLCPSSLMLGVTTCLSAQIAPMPAIWMLPLSLYLLSFIIAFAQPPKWARPLSAVGFVAMAIVITASGPSLAQTVFLGVVLHCGLLFCGALTLHCQVAEARPEIEHLTEFYLWISFGGVIGSICNALIAPLVFNWLAEYPLMIAIGILLLPGRRKQKETSLAGCTQPSGNARPGSPRLAKARGDVDKSSGFRILYLFARLGIAAGVLTGMAWNVYFSESAHATLLRHRSFYGEFQVTRGKQGVMHRLVHGGTEHGLQIASKEVRERRPPLTYYFFTGPIGQVILANRTTGLTGSVGVVGLGVGSLAAYAERGDEYTFYEIDPAIDRVAQDPRYFTFLSDARQRGAAVRVVIGDARLRLRDAPNGTYGLLVLDAFTSDAVPVHLLTQEAISEYFTKLKPGGVLAFHISNVYVDLEPVLANLADRLGNVAYVQVDDPIAPEERRRGKNPSRWLVMCANADSLDSLLSNQRWRPARAKSAIGIWTDDQSNLLSVVRWK